MEMIRGWGSEDDVGPDLREALRAVLERALESGELSSEIIANQLRYIACKVMLEADREENLEFFPKFAASAERITATHAIKWLELADPVSGDGVQK